MKSSYAHISKKNYDPRARARTGCARTSCFENDKKVLESPETSRKLKKKFQKFFYPYNRKNLKKFCEIFFPKIFLSFFSVITEIFFFNFLDVSGILRLFIFFFGGFHESVQKVSGRYLKEGQRSTRRKLLCTERGVVPPPFIKLEKQ